MMLSDETRAQVERRMQLGGFASPDEVVQAALTLLDRQDQLADPTVAELNRTYPDLRAQIAVGLAEADTGQFGDGEAFLAELEAEERAFEGRPNG